MPSLPCIGLSLFSGIDCRQCQTLLARNESKPLFSDVSNESAKYPVDLVSFWLEQSQPHKPIFYLWEWPAAFRIATWTCSTFLTSDWNLSRCNIELIAWPFHATGSVRMKCSLLLTPITASASLLLSNQSSSSTNGRNTSSTINIPHISASALLPTNRNSFNSSSPCARTSTDPLSFINCGINYYSPYQIS